MLNPLPPAYRLEAIIRVCANPWLRIARLVARMKRGLVPLLATRARPQPLRTTHTLPTLDRLGAILGLDPSSAATAPDLPPQPGQTNPQDPPARMRTHICAFSQQNAHFRAEPARRPVIHRSRFPQRPWDCGVSIRCEGVLAAVLPNGRHSLCGLSGQTGGT